MSEQKTTTSAPSTNLKTTADIKKAKALATVVEKKRLQRESNERKNKISKVEENNDNCVIAVTKNGGESLATRSFTTPRLSSRVSVQKKIFGFGRMTITIRRPNTVLLGFLALKNA